MLCWFGCLSAGFGVLSAGSQGKKRNMKKVKMKKDEKKKIKIPWRGSLSCALNNTNLQVARRVVYKLNAGWFMNGGDFLFNFKVFRVEILRKEGKM